MQLVEAELKSDDDRLPPTIYAALVDSLFQNFMPIFAGTVTAHGGTCWMEGSEPGGARVVVELPGGRRAAPAEAA